MIIVTRHGERADWYEAEKAKIEVPFDPHLTGVGEKQAFDTGRHIKKLIAAYESKINEKGIQAIVIASPFLRTIQTAELIAKSLNVYNETIYIDDALAEYLEEGVEFATKKDILKELYSRINPTSTKYFSSKIADTFVKDEKLLYPEYPSQEYRETKRVAVYLETIKDRFKEFSPTKHVFVLVTHQFVVEAALEYYRLPVFSPSFCGYVHIEYDHLDMTKFTVLNSGENSHLNSLL